jgi:hypothetical protein
VVLAPGLSYAHIVFAAQLAAMMLLAPFYLNGFRLTWEKSPSFAAVKLGDHCETPVALKNTDYD